ncbi:hypothetical protein EVAR_41404_1 [Eumeta japonica]|uniref:Uncharacterized protein n=1 Tax=Eumeta variegata TaxID=151549 RepID=A0A4C1X1M5_EUMVA|nr:hypothetical protein EVAR_41404_1 [Eumeta japonica]
MMMFERGESTTECDILIEGERVEQVKESVYLGNLFTNDGKHDRDTERRVKARNKVNGVLLTIMNMKAGYGRRKMKEGSMQWRCNRCVVCVECLGKIDVETVMLESGVQQEHELLSPIGSLRMQPCACTGDCFCKSVRNISVIVECQVNNEVPKIRDADYRSCIDSPAPVDFILKKDIVPEIPSARGNIMFRLLLNMNNKLERSKFASPESLIFHSNLHVLRCGVGDAPARGLSLIIPVLRETGISTTRSVTKY